MDFNALNEKEIKYYQYLENQRENYVTLAEDNSSVKMFANILFSKKISNLNDDLSGLLFEEGMEIADLFCMLLELMLYGFDKFDRNLFELDDQCDDFIYDIKKYLKSIGFDMSVDEVFHFLDNVNLYSDRDDYYCQITPKPHVFFSTDDWKISNYRFITNNQYRCGDVLKDYYAYFISTDKKIFSIRFMFINHA